MPHRACQPVKLIEETNEVPHRAFLLLRLNHLKIIEETSEVPHRAFPSVSSKTNFRVIKRLFQIVNMMQVGAIRPGQDNFSEE